MTLYPTQILIIALLVASCVLATANELDDKQAKERIAACRTENCIKEVAGIYLLITSHDFNETDKRAWRAQLYDPEIWKMMEDGRWDAMGEQQKHNYAQEKGFSK